MQLYQHQESTANFWTEVPKAFNTSDAGTGKTIATLEGYRRTFKGRMLVLAPLSILEASWGQDIRTYMPGFTYAISHGTPKKRKAAFDSGADIIITNHDAVKWITKDMSLLLGFTHLCVDEFPAFKNRTSQRSVALGQLVDEFENIVFLSGTPNSNTVLDLWYPAKLLDGGKRLGNKFWAFRDQVCTAQQIGPDPKHRRWDDRPEAIDIVTDLLRDITIRFTLEDCIDMPERVVTDRVLVPPPWLLKQYWELESTSALQSASGTMTAVHASARLKKMLQLLSGAVYDGDGVPVQVHAERYELVMDLVAEREQCVIAFNWQHELQNLKHTAEKYGFSYGEIHGGIPARERAGIVSRFQDGDIRILICHPQSAAHGLTLTAGTTTIWCSPTYNAEHYSQFNSRIYRAGQKRRTETIRIAYRDTAEIEVYERLDNKVTRMEDLLELFATFSDNHNQRKKTA